MPSSIAIFSFILGTIIGSFLNVVALRFNTSMSLKGRSKCFSCGKNLSWHELIPILSFFFQNGKCKTCKSAISWQYPLIEIAAGVLFIAIFFVSPPLSMEMALNTVFYMFITCLLLVITIYDIKHKVIPDALSYTFAIVAFIKLFISPDLSFIIPPTLHLLAGPILALPFAMMSILSKGRLMGLGDAKLMLGIGWVLGISAGISAIALAFWIGAIVSVGWMYIKFGKIKSGYEIPFGPYLIIGMYLVLLGGIRVIDISI